MRGRLQTYHIYRATEALSGNVCWGTLHCPVASPQLASTSQEEAHIYSSGDLIFFLPTVSKGTSPYHLVWKPTGFIIVIPQDGTYLHALKKAAV